MRYWERNGIRGEVRDAGLSWKRNGNQGPRSSYRPWEWRLKYTLRGLSAIPHQYFWFIAAVPLSRDLMILKRLNNWGEIHSCKPWQELAHFISYLKECRNHLVSKSIDKFQIIHLKIYKSKEVVRAAESGLKPKEIDSLWTHFNGQLAPNREL